jgi:hypothetical protein
MDWTTIGGLVFRHVVTKIAGCLVTYGVLMDSQTSQFIGAVTFLAGIGLSVWDKYGHAAALAAEKSAADYWRNLKTRSTQGAHP